MGAQFMFTEIMFHSETDPAALVREDGSQLSCSRRRLARILVGARTKPARNATRKPGENHG